MDRDVEYVHLDISLFMGMGMGMGMLRAQRQHSRASLLSDIRQLVAVIFTICICGIIMWKVDVFVTTSLLSGVFDFSSMRDCFLSVFMAAARRTFPFTLSRNKFWVEAEKKAWNISDHVVATISDTLVKRVPSCPRGFLMT